MDCIIDTNVLIDYTILDSERHDQAKRGLEKVTHGYLPTVVVEEFVQVLARFGLGKNAINEKLKETLETYSVISITVQNFYDSAQMIMSEDASSFKRFNDEVILSSARTIGLPVFTFDRELIRECSSAGVEPVFSDI